MLGQHTLFVKNRHKATIELLTRLLEAFEDAGWEVAFPVLGSCETVRASLVRDVNAQMTASRRYKSDMNLGHGVRYSIQRMKMQ